jgi:mono/diheme cytochrome c family protein
MGIPIMIFGRMIRPLKVLLCMGALAAIAALATACGTERIKVPKAEASLYRGALLFSERCSGCHTLSYAATNGSAPNPRTALVTNGPNLDQRCERPVTRVLYAIRNGGFSGAIMPQNVVVGQDAIDVAEFVSRYAGTHAATSPGVTPCQQQPIGEIPTAAQLAAAVATTTTAAPATTTTGSTSLKSAAAAGKRANHKARAKANAKAKAQNKKSS